MNQFDFYTRISTHYDKQSFHCFIDFLNIIDDDTLVACLQQDPWTLYFIQNTKVKKTEKLIKPADFFAYIKKPSEKLIETMALYDPKILKYVKYSSEDIQKKLLRINIKNIRYFNNISVAIQNEAVNLYNSNNIYNHDFIPIFLQTKNIDSIVLLKLLAKTTDRDFIKMIKSHNNYKHDAKIILDFIDGVNFC
jgi:hypothetical protein